MSTAYKVGDVLKCLRLVRRRDRRSEIKYGDLVRVLQEFSFTGPNSEQLQDITVQRGYDAPIAVIHQAGDFEVVQQRKGGSHEPHT